MVQKIVVVRHGERVDFTFGDIWIDKCFDSHGKFTRHNLNMPENVINRVGRPASFRRDCPLTQVGMLQGRLVGKGLKEENILRPGFHVFVSPAYRSIQTAASILEGLAQPDSVMKVEPCLFEFTGWYSEGVPEWATIEELTEGGYNVDTEYDPFNQVGSLEFNEPVDTYYNRTYEFIRHLLDTTENDILLVGHGSTLEVATRQLTGLPPRPLDELLRIVYGVPYAAVAVAEKEENTKKWTIRRPGNLCLRHSSVNDFDAHKVLLETTA